MPLRNKPRRSRPSRRPRSSPRQYRGSPQSQRTPWLPAPKRGRRNRRALAIRDRRARRRCGRGRGSSKSATVDASAEAAEQRQLYDEIDATLKRARALLIEARQTLVTIIARQRALFAKTLFLRSRGLFSPALWKEGLAEAPRAAGAAATFFEERAAITASRVKSVNGLELSGVFAMLALGVPLLLFLARRVLARPPDAPRPRR